ncbi:MAG: tRNA (guanine(10)-N(2))-dimethyltransferase [Hadesarchaea archaeon]|nr:MAG: tRNA (guanine(10)-N(2))-dimethyltransferase [Hadesarchaea archaeon]
MLTQLVNEGQTKLEVPKLERFQTRAGDYAPSLAPVFYNPHMELCRDISVSVVQVLADELGGIRVCDPLAGVGVRGLRYAKEVKGVTRVVVNDRSQKAFELAKRNVELNGLASLVEVRNEDANVLLWENRGRFDFIDIDPFGSPAPFIDAACAALARKGTLAITATDTAPLSGTHVKACLRRYSARPLKTEYCHELGIRILIGFVQRVAGRHELALAPVLVHATRHYFRGYLRARKGARAANELLAQQGYVSHCNACGRRRFTQGVAVELPSTCECGDRFVHAGPLWLGRLMDRTFINAVAGNLVRSNFKFGQKELVLLNQCAEEADGPPTFYDVHELAGRTGVSPPKIVELIPKFRKQGYFFSRTHFSGTGFRTDAPMDEIVEIFKRA